jgi:hypothetical protein
MLNLNQIRRTGIFTRNNKRESMSQLIFDSRVLPALVSRDH